MRTGIAGFDEVTGGGLPRSRPTLVCGGPGSGKTLFAAQFIVNGIVKFGEPGVFMTFEETAEELTQNVASLGYDLDALVARKRLAVDHVRVERSEIEETGEYDLEGLFVRLAHAIESVRAKRVALDTIESLFGGLGDAGILRAELRRLFRWLKDRGVTAIVTGERGEAALTRQGLEEYVSDAVILLDHRVEEQISTRRLRVVKYRGSPHGTNEYPFLIDEGGIHVMPITSAGLDHEVSAERVSTGIARLDGMLGGKGYYRGTSILVSGTAGTGKTSVAAHFVDAACRRGERCLFFAFEESPGQIVRNMRSIGIDLAPWIRRGRLRFHATRPGRHGLETHLAQVHQAIEIHRPSAVVFDPVTSLTPEGTSSEVRATLLRLVDFLKSRTITTVFTGLTQGEGPAPEVAAGISSLMDTWLVLVSTDMGSERNHLLSIVKSRGMPHSNQIREFEFTPRGVQLTDVYLGPRGVLTGSARLALEAEERATRLQQRQDVARTRREVARRRKTLDTRIAELRTQFSTEREDLLSSIAAGRARDRQLAVDRSAMAIRRGADRDGRGRA